MSTEYHSAQEDFNILISKLPPWVMSNFVIWLDLKVAEYKIFGRILSESEKYEAREFITGCTSNTTASHVSDSTPRPNTSIHHQHQQRNEVGPYPERLEQVQPRSTNVTPKRKRPDKSKILMEPTMQQTSIDDSLESHFSANSGLGLRIIDSRGNDNQPNQCNKQTVECINLESDESDNEQIDSKPAEELLMEVSNEFNEDQKETQPSGLVSVIKLELPDDDEDEQHHQVLPTMQRGEESEINILPSVHSSSSWQQPSTSNEELTEESVAAEIEKTLKTGKEQSFQNKCEKSIDMNQSLQHGVYSCNLCNHGNQHFQTDMDAMQHLTLHHGIAASNYSEYISKVFKCRFGCGSVFRQIGVRNKHEKRVHMDKNSHCCPFCSKTFGSKYVLDAHIRAHTGEKLKCATCEKTFSYPHSLKEHESCCEFGPGANQRFPCDICANCEFKNRKFLFKSKKLLRQHMRMMHNT